MRVVIYARVSSDNGRQDTERQVADLTYFADINDMEIVEVFPDFQSGGTLNKNRIFLKKCLDFCTDKKNEIDMVLMSEVSRLGRDKWEMLELAKFFHDNKLNVYFVEENFALYEPDGTENDIFPLIFALHASFAERERKNIKQRLDSGYKQYRAKGGKVGRKKGSTKTKEQLQEEYKEVIKLLKKGTTIKNVAKLTGTSTATIARLKKTFGIKKSDRNA